MIIYISEACKIYNTSGLKKFDAGFDRAAIAMLPEASRTRFLVVYPDGMEEIKLK